MPYVNGTWYPKQQAPWSEPEEYLTGMFANYQLLNASLGDKSLVTSINVGDGFVAMSSKWQYDTNYDIVFRIDDISNNPIKGLNSVFLIPNTDPKPVANPKDFRYWSTGAIRLGINASEYVGPISVTGEGWMGGSHLSNGNKTGETISMVTFVDGKKVDIGFEGYCFECFTVTENALYSPADAASGVYTLKVKELIKWQWVNGSVAVDVNHTFMSTVQITAYYGLQTDNQEYFDEVYFTNAEVKATQTWIDGSDSGDSLTYPDVDMCVGLESSLTGRGQLMWLDRSHGLGSQIASNIGSTDPVMFVANTTPKAYAYLIKSKTYFTGQSTKWRGAYSWFSMDNPNTNHVFNAKFHDSSSKYFIWAVKASQAINIDMSNDTGKQLEISTNDGGIVLWDEAVMPTVNRISSPGAGSIRLKIGS